MARECSYRLLDQLDELVPMQGVLGPRAQGGTVRNQRHGQICFIGHIMRGGFKRAGHPAWIRHGRK